MITLRFKRRATGQTAGAPAALKSAEPAYNMTDGKLYVGYGDDGAGNATGVKVFGQDNFIANVPGGGLTGQALVKNSNADGDWVWATVSGGGTTYTASADGIHLTGTQFSLNYAEIATGLALATTYAAKVHTHASGDILDLDAAKLTGTIDVARLPAAVFQAPIVSSGAIANLDAGQQASILAGSTVATTDGRFWTYSGTGSKTLEASYIEMADKTPDWSVIANKPAFATVATSGSYTDLINKPALGTMSSQNANAVAITGGSIDGVTLDGGTF